MRLYDTHVHTIFSADASSTVEEVVEKSQREGFGVIITDHYEMGTGKKDEFRFDPNEYFEKLNPWRGKGLQIGVELDLIMEAKDQINSFIKEQDFDYILGAIHTVDMAEIFSESYFAGLSKTEAYRKYLIYILECLKVFPLINSLAHYDFISRYSPYEEGELYYRDFPDYFDEIFRLLAEGEKALELNIKGLSIGHLKRYEEILKRFRELGGKYVTIGCDAHRLQGIGVNLRSGYELVTHCSLLPVIYINQEPQIIKY